MDARRVAQRMVVPFASSATPQTRFPETTPFVFACYHGDGGGLGAFLCRKPLEVACNPARLASWMASQTAPVASANLV